MTSVLTSEEQAIDKINSLKKQSYLKLKTAIDYDESKDYSNALKTYTKCIELLRNTLSELHIHKTNGIFNKRNDEIIKIEHDLEKLLDESNKRIEEIKSTLNTTTHELLRIENVNVYYIKSLTKDDQQVSTINNSTYLSIYEVDNDKLKEIYLRIGDYLECSLNSLNDHAILRTNYDAYIFPNVNSNVESNADYNYIGLTLKNDDKTSANDDSISLFEDILMNHSILIKQTSSEEPSKAFEQKSKSELISSYILNGANYVKNGIDKATSVSNTYIDYGSDKIKENFVTPSSTNSVSVNSNLNKCVQGLRYGTNAAVSVSSYLVGKLQGIAQYAGSKTAPLVKSTANTLLLKTGIVKSSGDVTNGQEDPLSGVYLVANSSVEGFSIVYESLEQASKCLSKNIIDKSVNLIDIKYGNDASKLAENTLYTLNNVATCAYNLNSMKLSKVIVKSTAKETIKNIIKND